MAWQYYECVTFFELLLAIAATVQPRSCERGGHFGVISIPDPVLEFRLGPAAWLPVLLIFLIFGFGDSIFAIERDLLFQLNDAHLFQRPSSLHTSNGLYFPVLKSPC